MKKFIVIGPCRMDILIPENSVPGAQITWMQGSSLQNAALLLGQSGFSVSMVSEVARDSVGSLLCRTLEASGVNTKNIDMVSTGEPTATSVFFSSDTPVTYTSNPDQRFDASWPRIDPGDVVIFGSPTLLTPRYHHFLSDFLEHIADRNAIAVYAPALTPYEVPRITRATPVILDLLEHADITLLTPTDTMMLFADTEAAKCYREHVRFYCPTMIYCNEATHTLSIHHHDITLSAPVKENPHTLMWQAGALASLASALSHLDIQRAEPKTPLSFSESQLQALASTIAQGADSSAQNAIINH